MLSCGVCVCVRLSVCPSVTFVDCVKRNKHIFNFFSLSGSQATLVFCTKRHGNIPTETPIECRWGRQKSRFWAYIWLHCVLWTLPVISAIHLAATDHGEFITLVAGKRRSLLMAGNNDEVYDKKPGLENIMIFSKISKYQKYHDILIFSIFFTFSILSRKWKFRINYITTGVTPWCSI